MEEKYYSPAPREARRYSPMQKSLLLPVLGLGLLALWFITGDSTHTRDLAPAYVAFWAFYLAVFYTFTWKKSKTRGAGWALSVAVALLFARYFLYEEAVLPLINFLVIPLLLMLHMLVCLYEFPAGTALRAIPLYLCGWFLKPFSAISRFFGAIGALFGKGAEGEKRGVLLGLICGIPLLIVVLALLLRADAAMEYFWARFIQDFALGDVLWRTAFVLLVAMLFYSFLYNVAWPREATGATPFRRSVPAVSFMTVVTMLLLAYLLFFCFQFAYLTGLHGLPEGLSYSTYAVRGFGELCAIAAINLAVFAVGLVFAKEHRGLSLLLLGLLIATLIVIASGGVRLYMYIQAYGFTKARLFSSWFILYLFAATLLCIARLFYQKLRLLGLCAGLLVGWYLCLNFVNVDAFIAKSILTMADKRGSLSIEDANYLRNELSTDAEKTILESAWVHEIYYDALPENQGAQAGVENDRLQIHIHAQGIRSISITSSSNTEVGMNADGTSCRLRYGRGNPLH